MPTLSQASPLFFSQSQLLRVPAERFLTALKYHIEATEAKSHSY